MVRATICKYPQWGEFLRGQRSRRFRSAREFCNLVSVGISYPQYSRYEAGDQLPNLEQALRLFELLDIGLMDGVRQWCSAQVSHAPTADRLERAWQMSAQTKAEEPVRENSHAFMGNGFSIDINSLNDVLVFNRSHLRLFESHPGYRDIFTYVNSFAPESVSARELAAAVGLETSLVRKMIRELVASGVLVESESGYLASKKSFYFPNDKDFFEVRNRNVRHDLENILRESTYEDVRDGRVYRAVITRELTDAQRLRLTQEIEVLMRSMVSMPESSSPDKVYSMCVAFGPRFTRSEIVQETPAAHSTHRKDRVTL